MSEFETHPLVALEAAAAGCRLLVADAGGLGRARRATASPARSRSTSAPARSAAAVVEELGKPPPRTSARRSSPGTSARRELLGAVPLALLTPAQSVQSGQTSTAAGGVATPMRADPCMQSTAPRTACACSSSAVLTADRGAQAARRVQMRLRPPAPPPVSVASVAGGGPPSPARSPGRSASGSRVSGRLRVDGAQSSDRAPFAYGSGGPTRRRSPTARTPADRHRYAGSRPASVHDVTCADAQSDPGAAPNPRRRRRRHPLPRRHRLPLPNQTPVPTPTPEPTPAPAPASNSIYWGAWIGNQLTGTEAPWDMNAVIQLRAARPARTLSIVNFSAPFANCSSSTLLLLQLPAPPS